MTDRQQRFTGIYRQCYRSVHGYALLRLEASAAEDVTAETFVVAWRKLDELREPELPWLLATCRNLIRKQYRWAARSSKLARRVADLATGSVGDVADAVAERHDAAGVLRQLSGRDIETLALTAWHGLTNEQAAQVLGISAGAYKVRLHRARSRLVKAANDAPLPGRIPPSLLSEQENAS